MSIYNRIGIVRQSVRGELGLIDIWIFLFARLRVTSFLISIKRLSALSFAFMGIMVFFRYIYVLSYIISFAIAAADKSSNANTKKLPKWIQSTYHTDLHCDTDILHAITYPLNKCIKTTANKYAMIIPFSVTDTKTKIEMWNIKWTLFSDDACKKQTADGLGVREINEKEACKFMHPDGATESGDAIVFIDKLYWTSEPPSFSFSGQRSTWYDDKDCSSMIRDQVSNLNYCWKGSGNGLPLPKDSPTTSYRSVCSDVSLVSRFRNNNIHIPTYILGSYIYHYILNTPTDKSNPFLTCCLYSFTII